jgi:hypothetical protein
LKSNFYQELDKNLLKLTLIYTNIRKIYIGKYTHLKIKIDFEWEKIKNEEGDGGETVDMRMLMLIGIIITGIYVLPSVTAKFAGSHTMEFNATGVSSMNCGDCHQYVQDELNATSAANSVIDAHITALTDSNYTNSTNTSAPLAIDSIPGATISDVCMLCHEVQTAASGAHTKVTIRACTDVACHGLNSSAGIATPYPAKQNITEKLSSDADAHSVWYNAMTSASPYKVEDVDGRAGDILNQTAVTGSNYTISFYTCLGCHTHVGIDFSPINRWNRFTINVTFDTSGAATIQFINMTDTNSTYASKLPGSVW